jgi:hypothetical protein
MMKCCGDQPRTVGTDAAGCSSESDMSREFLRRLAVVCVVLCAMLGPLASFRVSAQSGSLTCDDFTNTDAAQIVFDLDEDEFADLDEDGDGEACNESGDSGGSGDVAEVTLGADIGDVEAVLGDPEDDTDEDDFATGTEYAGSGDIESVNIYWLNDTAARVAVTFSDDASGDDPLDIAFGILPADVVMADEEEELEDGAILIEGTSDDLADLYTDADYEDAGVDGAAGDLRVILIPNEDGSIATIDVAIGDGSEYEPGDTTDSDDTDDGDGTDDGGTDADTEDYLATVRDAQVTMTDDLITFTELLADAANWTDADIETFTSIVNAWATIEAEAASLDVPDGLEVIQVQYEAAAAALGEVSTNITRFINESDEAALDTAFEAISTASTALTELDTLLTAAGG